MIVIEKRVLFIIVGLMILLGIISYRVYDEIALNQNRLEKVLNTKTVTVQCITVKERDITPVFEFSGKLEAGWSMDIIPQTDGRVEKLYVAEGDRVKPGAPLALLDARELAGQIVQAEANLLASQRNLAEANADVNRGQALIKLQAISQQTVDSYLAKRDVSEAEVKAAEGNLFTLKARMEYSKLTAPHKGYVSKVYLQEGAYARTGLPLVNIADDTSLLAKLLISDDAMRDVTIGMPVTITVNSLEDKPYQCKVTKVQPPVDFNERIMSVHAVLPNQDGALKIGMVFGGKLMGAVRQKVLAVPKKVILMLEGKKYLYVLSTDNIVKKRAIAIGSSDDNWVEIKSGIQVGDTIVVSDLDKLEDGRLVNAVPASNL